MSELQNHSTWDLSASTEATAINFSGFGVENTFYIQASTGASTGTVSILSARIAAGPWATIASTVMGTTGGLIIQEVTGPLLFVKPSVPSTGYTVEAVSFG